MREDLATPDAPTTPIRVALVTDQSDETVTEEAEDLARQFLEWGDAPFVLKPDAGPVWADRQNIPAQPVSSRLVGDTRPGYPVYTAADIPDAIPTFVEDTEPDIAVIQDAGDLHIARQFRELGIPLVFWLGNRDPDTFSGKLADFADASFVAGSDIAADRFRTRFGLRVSVVTPLFNAARFRVAGGGGCVTVSGASGAKGFEAAVQLATACPDIPFLLHGAPETSSTLSNIKYLSTAYDRRHALAQTRLILAPGYDPASECLLVAQAQLSGIPVLTRNLDGLAEAIGPGGEALPPKAGLRIWIAALRTIWYDAAVYTNLRAAALSHANRTAMAPERQLALFRAVLTRTLGTG